MCLVAVFIALLISVFFRGAKIWLITFRFVSFYVVCFITVRLINLFKIYCVADVIRSDETLSFNGTNRSDSFGNETSVIVFDFENCSDNSLQVYECLNVDLNAFGSSKFNPEVLHQAVLEYISIYRFQKVLLAISWLRISPPSRGSKLYRNETTWHRQKWGVSGLDSIDRTFFSWKLLKKWLCNSGVAW